ncbi:MAG: PAS domain S-box protein [Opitutales bacterium]|nr:PAS domain S-box protein [Opitutales bacterium]
MKRPAHILVVDDNDISRDLSARVLAKTGLRVVTAITGREALEVIGKEIPALVLLDVVLPDISGFEVLRRMRACPQMARVPIVFLSSERIRPEDQAAGLDAGSDGYIVRPLANAELLARVRLHLRQGELAEDLHESEQRYRLLFESNPLPMLIIARETLRVIEVNEAAMAHYGYSRAEFLDLTITDLRPAEDAPAFREVVKIQSDAVKHLGVWRHLRRDGSLILVDITSHRLEWQGHDASLVLINDVTERERAAAERTAALERERLARAEADAARQHYQLLFEHAPGAYLVISADTSRIVTASDAFLEMTGRRRDSLIDRSVFDVFPAGSGGNGERALRDSFARVKDFGTTDFLPVQSYPLKSCRPKDDSAGEEYWSIVNTPVLGADGAVRLIIQRVEDLSAYIRTQSGHFSADSLEESLTAPGKASLEAKFLLRSEELRRVNERLAQSEALLKMASRAARFGGWLIDLPDSRLQVSDEIRALLEIPAGFQPSMEELFSFFLSPCRETLEKAVADALKEGEPFDLEAEVISARSREMWARVTGEAVRGDKNQIIRVQGTFQDVSARKRAEKSFQESERRFRQLAEALPFFVWSATPEGRVDYANRRFGEYCGVPEGSPPLDWLQFLHPDDRSPTFSVWEKSLEGGEPYATQFRIREAATGFYRWFQVQAEPVYDDDEKLVAWYGAAIDIHENQRLREEAVRVSERFSRMLESITDAFCSIDHDWRFTYINREFERILGVRREDLLGRNSWDIFPDAVGTRFEREYRRAMEEGRLSTFVEFYPAANKLLELRLFPTPDGLSIFFRDVTKIRKDEEQLRLLANAMAGLNDIVVITSAQAVDEPGPVIVFINEAFERLTGYAAAEVIGRSPRFLQGEKTDPAARRRIREALAAGEPIQEEIINYAKDGREYILEISIHPIRDEEGQLTHFVAIERDVTDDRAAAAALQASQERFRLLARATSDAIWDWDPASGKLEWSDGFAALFGYDPKQVVPTFGFWRDCIHPDDREQAISLVERVKQSKSARYSQEYRFRREDGSYAYVRDHALLLRDAEGRVVRAVGGMSDISETHEVMERLHLLGSALNAAADPVFIADREGRLLWVNRAFTSMKGFSEGEALGKTMGQLVKSGKQDKSFYEEMWKTILSGKTWSEEMINQRKDGSLVHELVSITPVLGASGEVGHFIAIERDITEEKLREQHFLRAQRMESIGTLAGGIAHDLNNVLSPIVMGVSLIRQIDESGKLHPIIDEIQRSAERGRDLVQQVLSFARGVEGHREPLSLSLVIREIGNIVRNSFPKSILFTGEAPEDLWTVVADPTQIHQVLLNLCVNARDAMPEGGQLTVSAGNFEVDAQFAAMFAHAHPGPYVVVEVADTGCGMDPQTIERVFEPFFTTKPFGKGTGLGLSTVAGIVRSHKGFANVYSEVGQGTRFKVYLPAVIEPLASPDEVVFDLSPPRGRGECILVVDDEAAIVAMAKQTLEAFGYTVFTAENGTAAMAVFATEREFIDLVLTDMMMPEMDGVALIRALKRIDPAVRIIAASGLRAKGGIGKAVDSGVQDFLPKPYSSDTMLRLVREVLDREGDTPTSAPSD